MNKIQVALVQTCSKLSVETNLYQIGQLLNEKLIVHPDVLVLPECFASMGGVLANVAKEIAHIKRWMSEQASNYSCWVVGGTVPYLHENETKFRASCFVYDPQGNERARYDKIHLFDAKVVDSKGLYQESDEYLPGNTPTVIIMGDVPFRCLGLSVCYDLRFPELYRALVELGANILCVPSAFTQVTGKAHWEPLLRARAIENQCIVIAANQGGWHAGDRETWGHSMIISPWGEILAEAGTEPTVLSVNIDLSMLYELRATMPCYDHRRL
ncbi:MAG: carbon-nitrogen hydrolase family protein [Candidatus Endonucleobacter sp. (ex Gigantidas childressi)]|nr:carbon-nitrogen hydrolase family protein [Candidatus Endonucleobacter sp. (ex Gigantidas childressi)]